MKKNPVLPYNMEARAFKGTERAQSDSSLEIYANCPANFAYNYGLFARRGKPEKFVWFIYGSVIHSVADSIRTDILINKRVNPSKMSKEDEEKYFRKYYHQIKLAMDPEFAYQQKAECEPFIYIPRESIDKMGPKKYRALEEKKRRAYLEKAWNTIKAVFYSTRVQTKYTFNKYEWRFSSQKFRAPNLHMPEYPIWLLGAFDEINYMQDGSDLWYIVVDLKSGNKTNLKLQNNHQMLMYNYVLRNIDHSSPSQQYRKEKDPNTGEVIKVPNPTLDYLKVFNGIPPRDQFLVSLDIDGWALHKHGDYTLYSEDFRLPVDVNFDVEWPEHHKFISDVSTEQHYMLKGYDKQGHLYAPTDFEPLSIRGKQIDIGRSMREQRFVPRIGPRCGLCPAKQWCKEDHPVDWEQYKERHGLGINYEDEHFVTEHGDFSIETEDDGGMILPDENYIPKLVPVQQVLDYNGKGQSKHNVFIPKTVPKRTLKEMMAMGFMPAKRLLAYAKRQLRQLPFLEGGYMCQCMKFKDLIPLPLLLVLVKYIEGKWSLNFNATELHQFMCINCPVDDCLRRAEHLAKTGQTKDSIAKFKVGSELIELGTAD